MKKFRLEHYRDMQHPVNYQASGNNGCFILPHYRINDYEIRCIVSDGMGWEHVSVTVSHKSKSATRCPTWEEMCWVKDQFWEDEEVVVQYHPAKSEYVSMHPHCLHLWRPTDQKLPTPNPLMVGINLNI